MLTHKEMVNKMLRRPDVKAEYDAQAEEFALSKREPSFRPPPSTSFSGGSQNRAVLRTHAETRPYIGVNPWRA